jgi:hypothetical protein
MTGRISCLVIFLLILFSCNSGDKEEKKEVAATNAPAEEIQYRLQDSMPLYNDSAAFSYINLQKIDSGFVLAFQHPNLNLSVLDTKGNIVKKIGVKGSLPENFRGDYLETGQSANGKFYVLDEGSVVWLKVYDASYKLQKTIDLHRHLKDYTVPPVTGSFTVISVNDSIDRFIITPISTVMNPTDKEFYEKNPVLIQFDLSVKTLAISNIKNLLSFADISSIADAIESDKKKWEDAVPLVKYYNNLFYLKFPFDNDLYVYDSSWKLQKKYQLRPAYKSYDFSTKFKHEEPNMIASFAAQMQQQFSNHSYNAMAVVNDKAYFLYPMPIEKDKVPKTPHEWQKFVPTPILHVVDLKTDKQWYSQLPGNLNTFYIYPVADSVIYITQHPFSNEDLNVYKLSVQFKP